MDIGNIVNSMGLLPHPEGGSFKVCNEDSPDERASSGHIYYYLAENEHSEFHTVDCDEYWCYHIGAPIEIWVLDPQSLKVEIVRFGVEPGCVPTLLVKKHNVFGARHVSSDPGGTLVSCITVPRYQDEIIFPKDKILRLYPQLSDFFNNN